MHDRQEGHRGADLWGTVEGKVKRYVQDWQSSLCALFSDSTPLKGHCYGPT